MKLKRYTLYNQKMSSKKTISKMTRNTILSLLFATLSAAILSGPASAKSCAKPTLGTSFNSPVAASAINQKKLSVAVADLVNFERCKKGRDPLAFNPALTNMAKNHSKNMAAKNQFSHKTSVSGHRTLKQRARTVGVKYRRIGENIALQPRFDFMRQVFKKSKSKKCSFSFMTTNKPVADHSYASLARTLVQDWMSSKKHRQNILDRRFSRVGTGIAYKDGKFCGNYFATQVFAN